MYSLAWSLPIYPHTAGSSLYEWFFAMGGRDCFLKNRCFTQHGKSKHLRNNIKVYTRNNTSVSMFFNKDKGALEDRLVIQLTVSY